MFATEISTLTSQLVAGRALNWILVLRGIHGEWIKVSTNSTTAFLIGYRRILMYVPIVSISLKHGKETVNNEALVSVRLVLE